MVASVGVTLPRAWIRLDQTIVIEAQLAERSSILGFAAGRVGVLVVTPGGSGIDPVAVTPVGVDAGPEVEATVRRLGGHGVHARCEIADVSVGIVCLVRRDPAPDREEAKGAEEVCCTDHVSRASVRRPVRLRTTDHPGERPVDQP